MPNVTLQVMPAVEHPVNNSGMMIADSAAWCEHAAAGYVFTDPETVDEVVRAQIADTEAGSALYWAVALEANGPAIGCCDLSEIDRHHGRAEVGFLFSRATWGHGYALEAMTAIVDCAFGDLDLVRLWARFHAGNERSRALLERLKRLKETGVTVLLAEQNLRFATELADRIYIIERGEIRYEGQPGELAAHPEVREKYLMV